MRKSVDEGTVTAIYATANCSGLTMDSDAAYSICSTLLGISICDFDDAWTTNGRIATTPPFGTTQSTGAICAASSWMLSSVSTPSVCVAGRTRSEEHTSELQSLR